MSERLYLVYLGLFVAVFAMTPILNARVVEVAGVTFLMGVPITGLAYACNDVVNNHWGKRRARDVVVSMTMVRAVLYFAILPAALALPVYKMRGDVDTLLTQAYRNLFAGLIVTFCWQYWVDVPTFTWLRDLLKRRYFIGRYNVLQVPSTLGQSAMYVFGAYAFVDGVNVWSLISGQVVAKIAIAVAMTPVVFVLSRGTGWVLHREGHDAELGR